MFSLISIYLYAPLRKLKATVILAFIISAGHSSDLLAQNNVNPFSVSENGLQFTLHGSNTIGAHLGPNLVESFFRAKGLTQVNTLPTGENEYRVTGHLPGNGSNNASFYADIAAHGSSTGFASLLADNADIAMSSRLIKRLEIEKLADKGNFKSFRAEQVIAIDGLAVIVNPGNAINELSIQQIAKIFSGEIHNWKELGGRSGTIKLYARDENSGTWDTFKHLVLNKNYTLSAAAKRFESNDQLSAQISTDINGIGFVALGSVDITKPLAVSDIGTLPLKPTKATVATEDYPLSRRLFLYASDTKRSPIIDEFLNFVQSNQGQEQVSNSGFIAQTPLAIPADANREGPAEYISLTDGAARLSINVRFREGSAVLDNKAQQDILRIARFMQLPANKAKELILIGFGDAKLNPQRAQILSKLRAITVKSALYDHSVLALPVAGFGAYRPVAANQGSSRLKNQRVEVWVHSSEPKYQLSNR